MPNNATIDEACEWMQQQTGQNWTLPRLLEDGHLRPYVWLDCMEGYPQISGSNREGHLTEMVYHGDVMRLAADRNDALLTMFTAHDGTLVSPDPAWRVELKNIRFKKKALERVAEIINKQKTAPAQIATPAPLVALEAQRGYILAFPSRQTHVQFGELAHLIADALWPDAGADDTRMSYGLSRASLDGELVQAVKAGTLQVKDPLTFGPHTFPVGNALLSALVTADDLREFVAGRGLTVETEKSQATALSPAPVVADGASGEDEPWKEQARARARARAYEIIKRDKAKDLYPSQVNIADEIAKQFRRDCLTGADGKPLTGAYIKRHALNGISSAQSKLVSTVMRQSK